MSRHIQSWTQYVTINRERVTKERQSTDRNVSNRDSSFAHRWANVFGISRTRCIELLQLPRVAMILKQDLSALYSMHV